VQLEKLDQQEELEILGYLECPVCLDRRVIPGPPVQLVQTEWLGRLDKQEVQANLELQDLKELQVLEGPLVALVLLEWLDSQVALETLEIVVLWVCNIL